MSQGNSRANGVSDRKSDASPNCEHHRDTRPGGRLGSLSQSNAASQSNKSFEELKRLIHGKLVDKLDLSRVSEETRRILDITQKWSLLIRKQ